MVNLPFQIGRFLCGISVNGKAKAKHIWPPTRRWAFESSIPHCGSGEIKRNYTLDIVLWLLPNSVVEELLQIGIHAFMTKKIM